MVTKGALSLALFFLAALLKEFVSTNTDSKLFVFLTKCFGVLGALE